MGAGYGIAIFEVTPFDLSSMKEIVLQAPRTNLGADVRQVGEERVQLGDVDGLRIEYEVTTPEGVDAVFINTMYSDERGTLQVLTWTSAAVVDRFRDELLRFHGGLAIHRAVER